MTASRAAMPRQNPPHRQQGRRRDHPASRTVLLRQSLRYSVGPQVSIHERAWLLAVQLPHRSEQAAIWAASRHPRPAGPLPATGRLNQESSSRHRTGSRLQAMFLSPRLSPCHLRARFCSAGETAADRLETSLMVSNHEKTAGSARRTAAAITRSPCAPSQRFNRIDTQIRNRLSRSSGSSFSNCPASHSLWKRSATSRPWRPAGRRTSASPPRAQA